MQEKCVGRMLVRKHSLFVDPSTKVAITELVHEPSGDPLALHPALDVDVISSNMTPLGQFEQLSALRIQRTWWAEGRSWDQGQAGSDC